MSRARVFWRIAIENKLFIYSIFWTTSPRIDNPYDEEQSKIIISQLNWSIDNRWLHDEYASCIHLTCDLNGIYLPLISAIYYSSRVIRYLKTQMKCILISSTFRWHLYVSFLDLSFCHSNMYCVVQIRDLSSHLTSLLSSVFSSVPILDKNRSQDPNSLSLRKWS